MLDRVQWRRLNSRFNIRDLLRSLNLKRFEHEHEIDYEYEFLISNQSPLLNPHSSLLLNSRSGDCRNKIGVISDHLKHVNKVVLRTQIEMHSRSQRRRFFRSAPRITTSGVLLASSEISQSQWRCIFVTVGNHYCFKLPSLRRRAGSPRFKRSSWFGTGQRSLFLVLTERIAASGDKNDRNVPRHLLNRSMCSSSLVLVPSISQWKFLEMLAGISVNRWNRPHTTGW